MTTIDIKGLDPAMVLIVLYRYAKPFGLGFLHYRQDHELSLEEAREVLSQARKSSDENPYIDYLHGRLLKVEIGGETLNATCYDRDNGYGMAEAALATLRG